MKKLIMSFTLILSMFAFYSFVSPTNLLAPDNEEAGATIFEIPYAEEGFLCNGEYLVLTGTWTFVQNIHDDANGGFHVVDNWRIKASGVGSFGNEYRLNYSDNYSQHIGADGLPFSYTNPSTFNIVGKGKAPNLKQHVTSHVTVNNNGEVTVDFIKGKFTCK